MSGGSFMYKGYTGSANISIMDKCLYGNVTNINDTVTYQADSLKELETEFRKSVDDYEDLIQAINSEEDTRYSGVGGEKCQNCGRIYKICWKAPDDIWEIITGGKSGESSGGLLCPLCFDALCAANGIRLFWECKEDV